MQAPHTSEENAAQHIARRFLETQIVVETQQFQTTHELYLRYQQFVETQDLTPAAEQNILEDRKLYKLIREQFNIERTRRRIDGYLQYGFIGIRVREAGADAGDTERQTAESTLPSPSDAPSLTDGQINSKQAQSKQAQAEMTPAQIRQLREWRTQEYPVPILDIAYRLDMPLEVVSEYCKENGLV